jgi:ATP-dependent helicase HrpA
MAKHTSSTLGARSEIFGRSIDDIEDQLDLMHLVILSIHSLRGLAGISTLFKSIAMRLERLPNNLQRDKLQLIMSIHGWKNYLSLKMILKLKNCIYG